MIESLQKIFRNLGELIDSLLESFGNATFVDYLFMFIIVLICLILLYIIVYYLFVFVYALLGFELKISKSQRYDESKLKWIKSKINNNKETFELKTQLKFGLRNIEQSVKNVKKEQDQKLIQMDQQVIDTYSGTKSALQRMNQDLQATNNNVSTLNNIYTDFLKIYEKMRIELDSYQKGYDYSKNKLLFKKIIMYVSDIYKYDTLDQETKTYLIESIDNILADFMLFPIAVKEGDKFDPRLHEAYQKSYTNDPTKTNTIKSIFSLGYYIGQGEQKIIETYPKVVVYVSEEK